MGLSVRQLRIVRRLEVSSHRWLARLSAEMLSLYGAGFPAKPYHRRLQAAQARLTNCREFADDQRIWKLCGRLCESYVAMPESEQADMRKCIRHDAPTTILSHLDAFPSVCATRIVSEVDTQFLRRGLVAAAITGGLPDWRDALVSLSYLYRAGRDAGLDVEREFQLAASLAGNVSEFHNFDMAACLSKFHSTRGSRVDSELEAWEASP